MDSGEADDVLGPVGLIPKNRGITSTAVRSTKPETGSKARQHRSGSGASSLSARSVGPTSGDANNGENDDDSDEFIDAEEGV